MLLPSSAAGTNGGGMTGRGVGEREEASESLQKTLSTGRWGKAWAEHILKKRSCSRGWVCSTHGCLPRCRWSSPLATWAARTCLRMIWLVLSARSGIWEGQRRQNPHKSELQVWEISWGSCLLCWQRAKEESGFLLLGFSLCFLLSSHCWFCDQVEEGRRKKEFGWNSSNHYCFCWDQLPSLRLLCPQVRSNSERRL